MFNKWYSLSANDFRMLYIQQEINIFSNSKFVFSPMSFIFSNFKYAFKEMKFIKLKSFTFSKPNLDVTSYTSKSIQQNERAGLYFLAFFERLCLRVKFSFFFFAIPLVNELMTRTGMGVEAWSHACGQGCCMNIAMTYSYFFSWGLQQNVLLVFLLMV